MSFLSAEQVNCSCLSWQEHFVLLEIHLDNHALYESNNHGDLPHLVDSSIMTDTETAATEYLTNFIKSTEQKMTQSYKNDNKSTFYTHITLYKVF